METYWSTTSWQYMLSQLSYLMSAYIRLFFFGAVPIQSVGVGVGCE